MAAVALFAFAGWWMFGRVSADETPDLIMNTVSKGPYDFVVIEQGQVESATNVELRCEVRARGGGGGGSSSGMGGTSTTILEIVDEGKQVEAGDIVVKLDSSAMEDDRDTQRIAVAGRQAAVVQAENTLAASKIARDEYLYGTFVQSEKQLESLVFVANQALTTAQNQLNSAKALQLKGIVTALQVETAQFNLDNAQKQLEVAQTNLDTLRKYTKEKMLKDLDSAIATAEANLAAQQSSLALEEDKLHDIEEQIEKCIIKAPQAGQVVYANQIDSWRGSSSSEFIVAPGVAVRERQVIVRLPNPQDMQVKATVNEARVTLVRPGLPVTIRVDALKDELIEGVVTRVNPYSEPQSYSSGNIKRYATYVKILNPPPGLRSGMNAEVRIHVERKPEALQVPVQALAEYKGHFFTLVKNGEKYETREIKINSTNDKVATIEVGLKEGDEVVMNPRSAGGMLVLPDLPDPTPAQLAEIQRSIGATVTLAGGAGAPGGAGGPGAGGPGGGGPGGGGPGGGKGRGMMTPAQMVAQYLESDADKDGRISKEELSTMNERRQQALATADRNKDGFLDDKELLSAAGQAIAKMRERMQEGGGRGGGGGGRRGGGEGGPGGGPGGPGGGPAGGAQ
jgi:multidrug efflux pump subunit AcrA (membrane-fusion protein)